MTDDSVPKFTLPKTRRDLSNLDELLVGSISPSNGQSARRESPSETTAIERGDKNKHSSRSDQNESRSMLKLILDDDLILATKVRAAEQKTTARAIVSEALRQYLKL
ncbi:hypothetical protein [Phyllobacterium sp. P30BS-XVII]|uniref:hypothetical protein n=1 Tax=Phyllobacterium sp. P30BS-XVII TaxID=2587046 RepID=UPI0015FABBC7|nr:hypothetical protein [Phyllobacterium sp. P30BS-XVII]MBA8904125.1 hypothetical protein [Phyllobacterium sp. P30BS-XVII]